MEQECYYKMLHGTLQGQCGLTNKLTSCCVLNDFWKTHATVAVAAGCKDNNSKIVKALNTFQQECAINEDFLQLISSVQKHIQIWLEYNPSIRICSDRTYATDCKTMKPILLINVCCLASETIKILHPLISEVLDYVLIVQQITAAAELLHFGVMQTA